MIKYIWQLPQILLALILITRAQFDMVYKGKKVYVWKLKGAISLGEYMILPQFYGKRLIQHEYGHTRQSLYFGWLYLIIIGVPSFVQAALRSKGIIRGRYFPEQWADRLGGIT